ncbi:TPA: rRNA adenine N-6-methyltransferase family protein, partial [Staphylococcus aureus]
MQNKTNQRNYGTYYTENPYIVKYMVSKLNISNDDEILEPSVGVGHFIEEIVKNYNFSHITMYDIDPNVSEILDDKFKKYNVTFYNNDTLTDETLLLEANSINAYSKIIGNPPYGASQSMDKRKLLKKLYPNSYVKETYSLFLELCLRLLKPNGILTF